MVWAQIESDAMKNMDTPRHHYWLQPEQPPKDWIVKDGTMDASEASSEMP